MSIVEEIRSANDRYAAGFEQGGLTFQHEDLRSRLGPEAAKIDFLPFPEVAERVRQSVAAIRESALLPDSFGATGFVYDVKSGRLDAVERAYY